MRIATKVPRGGLRSWRWLVAGGLAVAMPKCVVCVLGYAGLVAGAGWFGPELCGGETPPLVTAAPFVAGLLVAVVVVFLWRRATGAMSETTRPVRWEQERT